MAPPPAEHEDGKRSYSFPLLKPSDIFTVLREMKIPVTPEEIRSCNPEAVRTVFEVFIEATMGVARDEMLQPKFSAISAFTFPELHSDSVPEMNFFRTAKRLMEVCGIHDFALKDLLFPTPKRVRRQLSALINFAMFREERVAVFAPLNAETERLLKQKTVLEEQNAALQRELEQLEAECAEQAPALEEVKRECEEIKTEVDKRNREQSTLRQNANRVKDEYKRIKDEILSVDYDIANADTAIDELKLRIISSPQRIRSEVEQLADKLEAAKSDLVEVERTLRERNQEAEDIGITLKELGKTFALMEDVEKVLAECKAAKGEVKMLKQQFETTRVAELSASERKELSLQTQQSRKVTFARFKDDVRLRESAAAKALEVARQENASLMERNRATLQAIANDEKALADTQRKMRDDELSYKKELNELHQVRPSLFDID